MSQWPADPGTLAERAIGCVGARDWQTLQELLEGPLEPALKEPVLEELRPDRERHGGALSDLARTLVRRLDVGASAAVEDLAAWAAAPEELRSARERAWVQLSAGRRGEHSALRQAPGLFSALLARPGFGELSRQAQAVALIEAGQAHWRSGHLDGDTTLLEAAVELATRAADLAGPLPHAGEALSLAGDADQDLWLFGRKDGELRRAVSLSRRAVAHTPSGLPRLGWRRSRLASRLITLSNWEGTLAPLNEALELLHGAPVTADPEDRAAVYHDLSRGSTRRWQITRRPADLDVAVTAARQAVCSMPASSPDLRYVRSGLASALVRRGKHTSSEEDLNEALRIRRELLMEEIEPPRLPAVRANLAAALLAHGKLSGDRDHLEEGVALLAGVVEATPAESSQRAKRTHNLARAYLTRAADGDRHLARQTFEDALGAAVEQPEVRAFVAHDLGQLLEEDDQIEQAAEAYKTALTSLSELQSRDGYVADRLAQLGRLAELPATAARATLRAHGPARALQTAAAGRVIVLRETLGLAPAPYGNGAQATELLCLGASQRGGFVLLAAAGRVQGLECPALTLTAVRDNVRSLTAALERRRADPAGTSREIERVARWLGQVMQLERLTLPSRVSILPLGAIGLLPVHLAQRASKSICLSHTVTLSLCARRAAPDPCLRGRRGVIVAPTSVGVEPLRFAAYEHAALELCAPGARMLQGHDATITAVIDALRSSEIVHFAGHAVSYSDRPLESRILLSGDEALQVSDILTLAGTGEQLALISLSGCETAVIGEQVPDEAIGLPAAAVSAGARAVLSSAWPVSQVASALLSARFYCSWRDHPEDPAVALCHAQRWMSAASHEELAAACEQIGAPVSDPGELRRPLHWGSATITVL
jgi:CHAT domain-containing protein/tetratricopeptide (TPR) repeat protein